jgi:hypothetical protein
MDKLSFKINSTEYKGYNETLINITLVWIKKLGKIKCLQCWYLNEYCYFEDSTLFGIC